MKDRSREEYREIVDEWFTIKREFLGIEFDLKTLINNLIITKDGDNLCDLYTDLNNIGMQILFSKDPIPLSKFEFRSKDNVRKMVYMLYEFIDKYYPFFDIIEVSKALGDLEASIINGTESFGYHLRTIRLDFNKGE